MASGALATMKSTVREHAWWAVPPLVISLVLGFTFGMWGAWLAYAGCNTVGVWLYVDRHGVEKARTQLWMKRLAIPLLPVGVAGVLASGGGTTASESVSSASGSDRIKNATAQTSSVNTNAQHM